MPKIISVHSFRGGTGKSNTTANLTAIMAGQGLRVGVVDTDIQSPGIHVLFGMDETDMVHSLNDYLWGKCEIKDTAHDVTARLGVPMKGQIYLIPSSIKAGEIARVVDAEPEDEQRHQGRDLGASARQRVLSADAGASRREVDRPCRIRTPRPGPPTVAIDPPAS